MNLKLSQLDPKLRERIQKQIAEEDAARHGVLAGLQTNVAKSAAPTALVSKHEAPQASKDGIVVRITLIAVRRRLLDRLDNATSQFKTLKDLIAEALGVDDNDERIDWELEQVKTTGVEGTIMKVESY
jgi:hypothetical protein